MRIGTPLSASATRVMLLGAGELGKEVIIALQRLGVEVVAVDCHPNAPGYEVAHRAHVIDMTDPQALRALIEQERPRLVCRPWRPSPPICSCRSSRKAWPSPPVAMNLRAPHSELRLFRKPVAFERRRMGVVLATGRHVDEARARAKQAASRVRPVKA